MSLVTNQQQTEQTTTQKEITLGDRFGSGKYFAIQCEVFKDAQRIFNLPLEKAEKIAKAMATSLGAIFSKGQITFKGMDRPLDKDGKMKSIQEITKVKGLPMTNEVAMLRALAYCNSASANHVKIVAKLDDTLEDWVKGL